jgi:hypothetical protein
MHAEHFAEHVLGDASVERIGRQIILATESSKRSGGTIGWMMPLLVQIEQMQIVAVSRSAVTRKRPRLQ